MRERGRQGGTLKPHVGDNATSLTALSQTVLVSSVLEPELQRPDRQRMIKWREREKKRLKAMTNAASLAFD